MGICYSKTTFPSEIPLSESEPGWLAIVMSTPILENGTTEFFLVDDNNQKTLVASLLFTTGITPTVQWVSVEESFQGKGIASLVIQRVLEKYKSVQARCCSASYGLFQRLGFTEPSGNAACRNTDGKYDFAEFRHMVFRTE